jgi:hypothetical protein
MISSSGNDGVIVDKPDLCLKKLPVEKNNKKGVSIK